MENQKFIKPRCSRAHVTHACALHLKTAIDVKCDFFITKDGELQKRAQNLVSNIIIEYPIRISTPSSYFQLTRTIDIEVVRINSSINARYMFTSRLLSEEASLIHCEF